MDYVHPNTPRGKRFMLIYRYECATLTARKVLDELQNEESNQAQKNRHEGGFSVALN